MQYKKIKSHGIQCLDMEMSLLLNHIHFLVIHTKRVKRSEVIRAEEVQI
jgi:hypothetical protein